MSFFPKVSAALALTLFTLIPAAHAGSNSGLITLVFATNNDGAFIYFANANSNASCPNNTTRMAIQPSTPGGRTLLATAMLAFSTGRTVTATGTGACAPFWKDTEALQYLIVNP